QYRHPDSPKPKGKVLRVTDIFVKTLSGYAPFENLSQIDLQSANYEGYAAHHEENGAHNPNGFEKKSWRQDHVGQEKGGKPSGGCVVIQPMENRIKYRVKEKGKRANHDHHFKSDNEENDDAAPCRYPLDPTEMTFPHEHTCFAFWRIAYFSNASQI